MKINRAEMKREARLSMRTHRPSVFLVTLLLLLLLWVLEILSVKLLFPGENLLEIAKHYVTSTQAQTLLPDAKPSVRDFAQYYLETFAAGTPPSAFGRLLDVAISIMTSMLGTGFTLFCLNVSRGLEAGPGNLLDAFGFFFKVLWLSILTGILITLWTILFIIPGIIAYYRYSLAVFILLDDPDKGAMQCLRESTELTQGYKWQLFVLDLSFIGWSILSAIPFVGVYTMPYMEITRANFYRRISGRMGAPDDLFSEPDAPADES